jgi:hypothetical protein
VGCLHKRYYKDSAAAQLDNLVMSSDELLYWVKEIFYVKLQLFVKRMVPRLINIIRHLNHVVKNVKIGV